MKKITAFIIAFLMLFTFFSANAASTKKYKSKVIQAFNCINKADEYGYYDSAEYAISGRTSMRSQAFLYDFDNDGTKELVMVYLGNYKSYQGHFLSVYTIKNNKVKTLIKKKFLQAAASNPEEFAGVAKKGKTNYLFLQVRNNGDVSEYQTFKYYKIKNGKISLKYKIKANFTAERNYYGKVGKIKHSIKINGKKKTPSQLLKWQKGFKMSKVKRQKVSFHNKFKYYSYLTKSDTVGAFYNKYFL